MSDYREAVARILLKIQAVHFNDVKPFIFTSGTVSPVYVDCRKLISFPVQRQKVLAFARQVIEDELDEVQIDVIAGGESAGIPYAAWLADMLTLPMIYVRKKPKSFGRLGQIEGDLVEGAEVLLVEDLLFDAQSKINFCKAIRHADATVDHTLVVFDYANPKSRDNLKQHGIHLHALTDWPIVLAVAQKDGYFSKEQAKVVQSFLDDPAGWGQNRGFQAQR